jgi:hypothetical protein
MPSGGIHVTGLRELVRDLQSLGVEVADIKSAFGEIAAEAAGLAAGFAPRRTGKLAGSIRGSKAKNKAVVSAGGARVPYAGVQNYGWPARGIAASHYMQRADTAIRPRVVPTLERAIDRLIAQRGMQ